LGARCCGDFNGEDCDFDGKDNDFPSEDGDFDGESGKSSGKSSLYAVVSNATPHLFGDNGPEV
jgi:hypothetical protein